jgi:phosphotransferase system enzyme I (PtsI)
VGRVLSGLGVSPGVVVGPAFLLAPRLPLPAEPDASDALPVEAARDQVRTAFAEVAADLRRRAAASEETGGAILAAQVMILEDPVLQDRVGGNLDQGRSRVAAVQAAFGEFIAALAEGGAYFAERIADLEDLEYRVCCALLGLPAPSLAAPTEPAVLIARDIGPADVVGLSTETVLAIVTEEGGLTSHTAIVAKSLGLPAVVACEGVLAITDGTPLLVDGRSGSVSLEPSDQDTRGALKREGERRAELARSSGPGRTKDGTPVQLLVNIDASYETAATADSEGVGLFRTEFLYLDRATPPSLEEQIATYRQVFGAFAGRKVVVRTLDAGADKPLGFVDVGVEENPALGIRGLRVARRQPELLEVQLRAIAAAAAETDADVWVMAPMVSTVGEAREFAAQARATGLPTVGAMVEVPSLALRAAQVLEHCDFLSLGTNDLSQYTFAADRMLAPLSDLVDPWQPAVLELVRLTAEAGRKAGRPVGVCGEAAADPELALVLVGLGVSSLSMSPVSLAEVRASLAGNDIETCRRCAREALAAEDAQQARAAVRRLLPTA